MSKDYWVLQQRLLPHAERCSWWVEEICGTEGSIDDAMPIFGIHGLGRLYSDQGKLAEAEAMYQQAQEGDEKLCPGNNLGNVYANQGKLGRGRGHVPAGGGGP